MRLFIEIFKLCVTVDRSGSTKLEKMIKEKSFLLLLSATSTRMDPRIEERQLNFFVPGLCAAVVLFKSENCFSHLEAFW